MRAPSFIEKISNAGMIKKMIQFSFALFLLIHLSLSCLYIFRKNISSSLANISIQYCSPLFHQNWQLFAPDVMEYEPDLEFLHKDQFGQSHWINVSSFMGFENGEVMKRIEHNVASDLAWDYTQMVYKKDGLLQYESLEKTRSYQRAVFLIDNYLTSHKLSSDSISMRLRIQYTKNPFDSVLPATEIIELPSFKR